MKRYLILIVLTCILFGGLQIINSIQAKANLETALLAYGQSSIPGWVPIVRVPGVVYDVIDSELYLLNQGKIRLQADIDEVTSFPAGRVVWIVGGGSMSQTDWLDQATAAMVGIDAMIAKLQAGQ